MIGVILSGCVMPFSHERWAHFHAAVAAIAIAEIVRNGMVVVLYCRGWHGWAADRQRRTSVPILGTGNDTGAIG